MRASGDSDWHKNGVTVGHQAASRSKQALEGRKYLTWKLVPDKTQVRLGSRYSFTQLFGAGERATYLWVHKKSEAERTGKRQPVKLWPCLEVAE